MGIVSGVKMTTTLHLFKAKFKKLKDYLDPDFSSREAKLYEYAEMLFGELDTMTGGFDNDAESRD